MLNAIGWLWLLKEEPEPVPGDDLAQYQRFIPISRFQKHTQLHIPAILVSFPMPSLDESLSSLPLPTTTNVARKVFAGRLLIGLGVAAVGVLVARPHTLWGKWETLGSTGSALLVLAGMVLRFWAGGSAGTHTHGGQIEAPQLATGGPFAYVRNPIYLGSIVLGLGMVGLIGDPWMLPLWALAFAALYLVIIPAEERFLRQQFGTEYPTYLRAVPRLIPRLRPWSGRKPRQFNWRVVYGEMRIAAVLVCIYVAMELVARIRGT